MIPLSQATLRRHWRIAFPLGALLLAGMLILLAPFFSPTVTNAVIKPYAAPQAVFSAEENRIVLYEFDAVYRPWQLAQLNVRTNGCLHGIAVDGKPGNMQAATRDGQRCGYRRNLVLDLAGSLHYGSQHVTLLILHTPSQPLVADAEDIVTSGLAQRVQVVMLGVILASVLWAAVLYRMERALAAMLLVALGIFTVHVMNTQHFHFTHDLPGHLDYIRYVSEHFWRPPPLRDNITRHPPLYYWVSSVAYLTGKSAEVLQPWQWVRMVSVASFMVFLVYGLKIMQMLLTRKDWIYYLACALFIFWPNNMITATRINNDIMMYAFYAATVYYLLRWRGSLAQRDMRFALVALAGALLTKLSSMGLLLIFSCAVGEKLWKGQVAPRYALNRTIATGAGVVLVALALGIGANVVAQFGSTRDVPLASLPLGAPLSNAIDDIISTDTEGFSRSPFIADGGTERLFLVNYFVKTSLFGDFVWKRRWSAETMLTAWVVMLALMVVYAVCHTRREWRDNAAVWWLLLGSLIPYVGFRVAYATFPTQDFRYIYPMLIPLMAFWVLSIRFFGEKNIVVLKYASAAAGAVILALSVPFMLNQ